MEPGVFPDGPQPRRGELRQIAATLKDQQMRGAITL
jgi:hypothetical protein